MKNKSPAGSSHKMIHNLYKCAIHHTQRESTTKVKRDKRVLQNSPIGSPISG